MTEQQKKDFKVINGNSLEVLDTLEENSIDAIITDPPYELNFMSKGWDRSGIAFNVELWKKALRILKPGGHLLAFGGSRTFHRIAVAIEDAGFEIRDTIMWLYGSGFPKSMNIGKAIESYETLGNSSTSSKRLIEQSCEGETFIVKQTNNGAMGEVIEQERKIYTPNTENAKKWSGWGTCLKPAFEPIIMARKPIEEKSIAENCLKYGVGGINIDECRVGNEHFEITDGDYDNNDNQSCFGNIKRTPKSYNGRFPANVITDGSDEVAIGMPNTKSSGGKQSMPDLSDIGKKQTALGNGHKMSFGQIENAKRVESEYIAPSDEGSAIRYFYSAKASKKDRDEGLDAFEEKNMRLEQNRNIHSAGCEYIENGKVKQNPHLQSSVKKNIHPCVKPVELMQYLVRLITPRGGAILDIFNGSGSTGKAVAFENRERNANYKYIGIELEKEYIDISLSRIDYALNKYEYDEIKEREEMKAKGQLCLFDFGE